MKATITHKNISVINAYTFDIIPKGENTEGLINRYNHLEELPVRGFSTMHIGIYDYSMKIKQWKIKDVKQTINIIEKDNTNLVYKQLFEELRNSVIEIKMAIWEPDFLPFNYAILSVDFDEKVLASKKTYGWLKMLLLPLIKYWRPLDGMIPYQGEIRFPMFYQIYYESKSLKPELNKVMNDLEKFSTNGLDVTNYLKSCNNLKNYFLLENLDKYHNLISLLKIQDDFFMLGNIGQFDSEIFNVFSLQPDEYSYTGINPFFVNTFDSWPFSSIFLFYIISVTPIIWTDINRTKLTEVLKQVNELKTTYRTNNKLTNNTEKTLESLLSLKHDLNFLLSDSDEIKKLVKIFKNYILDNPEIIAKSIVITKPNSKPKIQLVKNKIQSNYLDQLNQAFDIRSKETEEYVNDIQKDVLFLKERIEPLQQKLERKNNSRLRMVMLFLALVTVSFAVIVGSDVIGKWTNSSGNIP